MTWEPSIPEDTYDENNMAIEHRAPGAPKWEQSKGAAGELNKDQFEPGQFVVGKRFDSVFLMGR